MIYQNILRWHCYPEEEKGTDTGALRSHSSHHILLRKAKHALLA